MKEQNIYGTWKLKRHGKFDRNNTFIPTSEYAEGKLIYAPNGSMSVLIVKKEQPTELSDLVAYSGKFSVSDSIINHHIEIAPLAFRRNTTEVRIAELRGDLLILKTKADDTGHYEIQWQREE